MLYGPKRYACTAGLGEIYHHQMSAIKKSKMSVARSLRIHGLRHVVRRRGIGSNELNTIIPETMLANNNSCCAIPYVVLNGPIGTRVRLSFSVVKSVGIAPITLNSTSSHIRCQNCWNGMRAMAIPMAKSAIAAIIGA